MNDFIRNLDVTFEIVSPINDIQFEIQKPAESMPMVNDITVIDSQDISKEEQITFSFDMPFSKTETVETVNENKILFDLTDEVRDIKVNEPVEFVPITELNKDGIIKYSLEEYMEMENDLLDSKPVASLIQEPIDTELNIQVKTEETPRVAAFATHFEDVTPVEMTIEETLKFRADERRQKLKEFNYKFHSNASKVDELEKEPAYKRSGIDISNNTAENNNSRCH